jgi:hypothetical protein
MSGATFRAHRCLCSFLALAGALAVAACWHKAPPQDGYRAAAVPGISRERVIAILGKPQASQPFSLPGVSADVLTYPFGQVLLQNGAVVAISISSDPDFHSPYGIHIGMSENDLNAAFAASRRRRTGHKESYDAIEKTNDTKTKDIFDDTDRMVIEMTATNANDALAPYNIAQVTLANTAGMALIDAFTKARVSGLYPDVHVDNFVSEPWQSGR